MSSNEEHNGAYQPRRAEARDSIGIPLARTEFGSFPARARGSFLHVDGSWGLPHSSGFFIFFADFALGSFGWVEVINGCVAAPWFLPRFQTACAHLRLRTQVIDGWFPEELRNEVEFQHNFPFLENVQNPAASRWGSKNAAADGQRLQMFEMQLLNTSPLIWIIFCFLSESGIRWNLEVSTSSGALRRSTGKKKSSWVFEVRMAVLWCGFQDVTQVSAILASSVLHASALPRSSLELLNIALLSLRTYAIGSFLVTFGDCRLHGPGDIYEFGTFAAGWQEISVSTSSFWNSHVYAFWAVYICRITTGCPVERAEMNLYNRKFPQPSHAWDHTNFSSRLSGSNPSPTST